MKNIFLILGFFLMSIQAFSQKIEPKWTWNVELGLPVAIANEPFDDVMQGLVGVSTYAQYSFPAHLHFGLGGRYSLFTINEFKVPTSVGGSLHTAGGFLKIGYDKFITDRFAVDFGVKIGYLFNGSVVEETNPEGDIIANHTNSNESILVEPTLGLILSADERSSYRLTFGYNIQGYGFKPSFIGVNTNSGWDPTGFNKLTQYLIVGFGYTHYFKSK